MPIPLSANTLWATAYQQLRLMAGRFLANERRSHTLQPTALVHEAFLRLRDQGCVSDSDRLEFCRAAANVMRRILIDHARRRLRLKRRQPSGAVVLAEEVPDAQPNEPEAVLDLDAALSALEEVSSRRAEIVRLRFYAGLGEEEVAALLHVSRRTVQSEFRSARAWLRVALERSGGGMRCQGAPRE